MQVEEHLKKVEKGDMSLETTVKEKKVVSVLVELFFLYIFFLLLRSVPSHPWLTYFHRL